MGAGLDYIVYEKSDRAEVKADFLNSVQISSRVSGVSYSGEIGMLNGITEWQDCKFPTIDDAIDFLAETHQKWNGAMAVSFLLPDEKKTKTISAAREKYQQIADKLYALRETLEKNFQNRQAEFVTCRSCKSKLNKRFVPYPDCPLCYASLLSNTDQGKIAKAEAKKETAEQNIMKVQKKSASNEIGWVVGGWCPS